MAINLDEIERGYAEAMLRKYKYKLEQFSSVFSEPSNNVGEMHIRVHEGGIEFRKGIGTKDHQNISNEDARNILNIIRMSIEDRIDKFEGNDES